MDSDSIQVMLVEDDEDDYFIIKKMIGAVKSSSFNLEWASTYERALELFSEKPHDIYLLDYRIGADTGLELMREMNNKGCTKPIIMLSTLESDNIDLVAMQLGAMDFLVKGKFDASQLERSMRYSIQQKEIEKRLRYLYHQLTQVHHQQQLILSSAGEGIYGFDQEGKFTFVNEAACNMLGFTERELIGKYVSDIIQCPGNGDNSANGNKECLLCQQDKDISARHSGNLVFTRSDGTTVPIEYVSSPIIDNRVQTGTVVVMRDITEHYKAEKALKELASVRMELIQSEKMAMLGQLSAGVAHEINNPIGFVMSNLGTLKEYVNTFETLIKSYQKAVSLLSADSLSPELQEILNNISVIQKRDDLEFILEDIDNLLNESQDGINRVKDIVQSLKSFARVDENEMKEININDCIETTLKIAWNELKYKCEVVKKYDEIPMIKGHSGQLNQVFMNLLVNAAQAISKHGAITIETMEVNREIVINISDTGVGIPEENLQEIFNPFFTTKPQGEGTGLGLSVSYGIVQKHGGRIEVKSKVGEGTTFTIFLPEAS